MKFGALLIVAALIPHALSAQPATPVNTVIVVPDPEHPWAAAQLGAVLANDVTYHEGSLLQALGAARGGAAVGVLEIRLDTSAAWETGRVVCYAPNGKKVWEEKVFVNLGGGAEGVARKFADKLEKKIAGKRCGGSS